MTIFFKAYYAKLHELHKLYRENTKKIMTTTKIEAIFNLIEAAPQWSDKLQLRH